MKTYVLVGTGYRGLWAYCEPIVRDYGDVARLAGVCDINWKRARLAGEYLGQDIPAYIRLVGEGRSQVVDSAQRIDNRGAPLAEKGVDGLAAAQALILGEGERLHACCCLEYAKLQKLVMMCKNG